MELLTGKQIEQLNTLAKVSRDLIKEQNLLANESAKNIVKVYENADDPSSMT